MPILHNQNSFSIKIIVNIINISISNTGVISKEKKYRITTNGKRTIPKALSNKKEKKIPSFVNSLSINMLPTILMNAILLVKNGIYENIWQFIYA